MNQVAPAAPFLKDNNRCSDCGVAAQTIANGEMKICPKCYGLLWRADQTESMLREAERTAKRLQQQSINALKRRELVEARRIARKANAEKEAEQMGPPAPKDIAP